MSGIQSKLSKMQRNGTKWSKPKRKTYNSNRHTGGPDMEVPRQQLKNNYEKYAQENNRRWRISQKIEIYLKKEIQILKLKNKITEIKNLLDIFNSTLDMIEEKKHELEDRSRENI